MEYFDAAKLLYALVIRRMGMVQRHDFCIIGGGIIGLSVANQLIQEFPGCSLIIFEKENQLGVHQTGHNSGVIHSGIYYTPGSQKARLCKLGASVTKEFCKEHKIPFEECGKMLVATNKRELGRMSKLAETARENEIDFEEIDSKELKRREPNISGLGALYVPSTGIVDYLKICGALAENIRKGGGNIQCGTKVTRIAETANNVEIHHKGGYSVARQLIVCAGAQSDRMVRLSGLEPEFRIIPFRGEYFRLSEKHKPLIHSLIYPIPDADLPFLGVHLTRLINSEIIVGPNAVLGMAREKYPKFSCDLKDIGDYLRFPGFWRVMKRHAKSGMTEIRNSMFKSYYLDECRKYCPSLMLTDLLPYEAGIRAQAVMRDGCFAKDFLFMETQRTVHVCNAPSPAATSCFPISKMIIDKIQTQRRTIINAPRD